MKRYLLPIIVSAVSLVVMTVVTYAYFTATIDPSGETTATLRTATVGSVTFLTTSPTTNLTNVYPGWEGTGSTTVYFNTNSDDDVAYHCTVQLESGSYSTNVYVQTISGSDAQVPTETALTEQGVVVSQGTLEAQSNITSPNHGTEHVVTYKIIFKEIGQAQNDDQGRTINTYTTCVIDQQSGSALTLVSGTMTDLSGDPIANQPMVAFSSPTYFTTDANGHYEVRLAAGSHNIYYVPGYTMEQTVAAGKNILTNESAVTKSVTVTAGNTQTLNPVVNVNAPTKTVSVSCTNCTADASSANVEVGGTASFTITADESYTLTGATVTGGCSLNESTGVLTLANVSDDATCTVSAVEAIRYIYWTKDSYNDYENEALWYDTDRPSASLIKNSPSELGYEYAAYIKTTLNGNSVVKHETCFKNGNLNYCVDPARYFNEEFTFNGMVTAQGGYEVDGTKYIRDDKVTAVCQKLTNDLKQALDLDFNCYRIDYNDDVLLTSDGKTGYSAIEAYTSIQDENEYGFETELSKNFKRVKLTETDQFSYSTMKQLWCYEDGVAAICD